MRAPELLLSDLTPGYGIIAFGGTYQPVRVIGEDYFPFPHSVNTVIAFFPGDKGASTAEQALADAWTFVQNHYHLKASKKHESQPTHRAHAPTTP